MLKERLKERILLMDGAMGTYYNEKYGDEREAEEANLSFPEQIIEIHKEYIDAGAEVIRTNTFAVNHHLFPTKEECKSVIQAAVANAREAIRITGKDVETGASIGPIFQDQNESDEMILREYHMLIDTFYDLGIRLFIFETFAEVKWVELLAEYCKAKDRDCVVMGQFSVNPMGYTHSGHGISEVIRRMSLDPNVDIFGFNCGVGAAHMKKLLEKQTFIQPCFLSVLPNAGYQQETRGRMRYGDDSAYFKQQMQGIIALGANVIGGCCGTNPEYIRELKRLLDKGAEPKQKKILAKEQNTRNNSVSTTAFMEKLQKNEKVFVVELDAPFDANVEKFRKGIYALASNDVDMVTVSDSPLARARADASLLAVYAKRCADISVMPHIAMRDRNLIGLRAEVLGAHMNGIRDMLVITGDPVGPQDKGKITGVFDMNSVRFMEYLKRMNEEVFGDHPVYYGGALNYAGVNVNAIALRMKKKIQAGCSYFLTQPIFSVEDVERIKELKEMVPEAKIICGIMPLVSYRNALFMKNEMPGIHVNDEILNRYHPEMSRDEAEKAAVRLCVEIAGNLQEVSDGYYIMTPFHRVRLVNEIIDAIRRL